MLQTPSGIQAKLVVRDFAAASSDGSSVLTSVASAAVVQLPSLLGGSVAVDGLTQATAIALGDSSDDDNGGANTSKVNNKEIVSFYLLLFSCMYMDV